MIGGRVAFKRFALLDLIAEAYVPTIWAAGQVFFFPMEQSGFPASLSSQHLRLDMFLVLVLKMWHSVQVTSRRSPVAVDPNPHVLKLDVTHCRHVLLSYHLEDY